jgi:two-component system NtrC family sensor kinase/two-component system sensor histidine kinase AtoS
MLSFEDALKDIDESNVLDRLNEFIVLTQNMEHEWLMMKNALTSTTETVHELVNHAPYALWVLNKDDHSLFVQNPKASNLSEILELIDWERDNYEISLEDHSYLINISEHNDKILVSAVDNTTQKREERLMSMGRMAAHLSHEIRNPIGSISLLTSTLLKRVKVENKPIVIEIQKAIFRIERIIKATLLFSKGISANKTLTSTMELQEELEQAIMYYSYTKEITINYSWHDIQLDGDLDLLTMMFSNFIFNAIDAIEEDDEEEGVIDIVHSSDKYTHYFKIYDTGMAIANPKMLFEAFESSKEKGNGLGLVLAKQIANAHGGSVRLLDEARKGFEISILK